MLWKQLKGRSERAKILETYRLDRFDSDRLRTAAAVAGESNEALIREILIRWLDQQEIEGGVNPESAPTLIGLTGKLRARICQP